jgi:hypothetical protein
LNAPSGFLPIAVALLIFPSTTTRTRPIPAYFRHLHYDLITGFIFESKAFVPNNECPVSSTLSLVCSDIVRQEDLPSQVG